MKKQLLTIVSLLAGLLATEAQTARVMAIHNSADPAVDTVDVWLTTPLGSLKIADNFGFRQSTGFITAPAGIPIRLSFAGKNSTQITDTLIGFGYNLVADEKYVLLAEGHVGSGFTPQQPFNLAVIGSALENGTGGKVKVAVHHGSTDAPAVDLFARAPETTSQLSLLTNVGYGATAGYLELDEQDALIDVHVAGDENPLLTYAAPLSTLNLGDSAVVIFASGFLNPSLNNNGKSFGLFASTQTGRVVPLPAVTNARLMAIHNCADPAADSVDIWLINNTTNTATKIVPNFAFRKATGYVDIPGNAELALGVALPGSDDRSDIIYTEDIGISYAGATVVGIATGVLDTSKFEANPNVPDISFFINGVTGKEKSATNNTVEILAYHGVTDAPTVNIRPKGASAGFEELSFANFSGDEYASFPATDVVLDVFPLGATSPLVSYNAPLSALAGQAVVVFASGFLSPNTPTNKDVNGLPFGLFVARANGEVIALSPVTGLLNRSKDFGAAVTVYPNPAKEVVNISYTNQTAQEVTVTLFDLAGKAVYNKTIEGVAGLNNITIPTQEVGQGIYLVKIGGNSGSSFSKVIVE
ncbi:MAG: T9SS C-terminal target domain-containing protein [Bacteroidetes bacterium]|nr:MAG: T9SS C-terminal target domain-containing protein [Bacteroidota bacterium]